MPHRQNFGLVMRPTILISFKTLIPNDEETFNSTNSQERYRQCEKTA
jgi:hypothetical protein